MSTEPEQFVAEYTPDNFSLDQRENMSIEITHLQKRVAELSEENIQLKQNPQIIVKKIETNVISEIPGLKPEEARRITELEEQLYQANISIEERDKELELLRRLQTRVHELEFGYENFQNENASLKNQLLQKTDQLDIFRDEINKLNDLGSRAAANLQEKTLQIEELFQKVGEYEITLSEFESIRKEKELLAKEMIMLRESERERVDEIAVLNQTIKSFEAERCVNPQDHTYLIVLAKENEAVIEKFNEFQSKVALVQEESEKLIQNSKNKDLEIEKLNSEVEKLSSEILRIQSEDQKIYDEECTKTQRLESELVEISKKFADKEIELETLKAKRVERFEEVTTDLFKLNELINEKDKIINALEHEKNALFAELEPLKRELMIKEEIIESRAPEFETLNEEINRLGSKLTEHQESLRLLGLEHSAALTERDSLLQRIENSELMITQLQEKNSSLNKRLEESMEMEAMLQNQIARFTLENSELRENYQKVSARISEYDSLRIEFDNLQVQLDKANLDKQELLTQIDSFRQKAEFYKTLEAELLRSQKEIELLDAERDNFNARAFEIDNLKTALAKANEEIQVQLTHLETFRERVETYQTMEADYLRLQKEFELVTNERNNLMLSLDERTAEYNNVKVFSEKTLLENEKLTVQVEGLLQLKNEFDILSAEREGLLLSLKDKSAEFDNLRFLLDQTNLEKQDLLTQIESFRKQFESYQIMEADLLRSQKEIEILMTERDRFNERTVEFENLKGLLEKANLENQGLLSQLESFRKQLEAYQNVEGILLQTQKELGIIAGERDNLLAGLNQRTAEFENLKVLLDKANLEKQELLTRVNGFLQLQKDFDLLTSERDRLLISLNERGAEFENLRALFDKTTLENQGLLTQIESFRKQFETYQNMESTLLQSQKELDIIATERDNLLAGLNERTIEFENLKIRFNTLSTEKQEMWTQLNGFLQLQKDFDLVVSERDRLLLSLNERGAEFDNMRALLDKATLEKRELLAQIETFRKQFESYKTLEASLFQSQKELGIIASERDNLLLALNERTTELNNLRVHFDNLNLEKQALLSQISGFEKQLGSYQGLEASLLQSQKEISLIAAERDHLKGLLEKSAFEKQEWSTQIETFRKQITSYQGLESELLRTQNENHLIIAERDRLLAVLNERNAELNNLHGVLADFEQVKLQLNAAMFEIDSLRKQLAANEGVVADFELMVSKLRDIEAVLMEITDERDKLLNSNNYLRSKSMEFERELAISREKYIDLEKLYRNLVNISGRISNVQGTLLEACDEAEKIKVEQSYQRSSVMSRQTTSTHDMSNQRF